MITKVGENAALDAANLLKTKMDIGLKGGVLAIGAGLALKSFINKIQNDTRRKAIIEDLMLTDPILKDAPKDQVLSFYATLNNVAPSIAVDKNAVREMLQHWVKFGTVDIAQIKMLAETQKTIHDNQSFDYKGFFK